VALNKPGINQPNNTTPISKCFTYFREKSGNICTWSKVYFCVSAWVMCLEWLVLNF